MKFCVIFFLFISSTSYSQINKDSVAYYSKILNDTTFKCNSTLDREKAFQYFIDHIELNKTKFNSVKKYLGHGTIVKDKGYTNISYVVKCKSYNKSNGQEYIHYLKMIEFTVIKRKIVQISTNEH